MNFDRELVLAAKDVLDLCRNGGLTLATAESCTGGLVVAALTAIAASSAVVAGASSLDAHDLALA